MIFAQKPSNTIAPIDFEHNFPLLTEKIEISNQNSSECWLRLNFELSVNQNKIHFLK